MLKNLPFNADGTATTANKALESTLLGLLGVTNNDSEVTHLLAAPSATGPSGYFRPAEGVTADNGNNPAYLLYFLTFEKSSADPTKGSLKAVKIVNSNTGLVVRDLPAAGQRIQWVFYPPAIAPLPFGAGRLLVGSAVPGGDGTVYMGQNGYQLKRKLAGGNTTYYDVNQITGTGPRLLLVKDTGTTSPAVDVATPAAPATWRSTSILGHARQLIIWADLTK